MNKETIVINIQRLEEYKDPFTFENYFKFYYGTGKDTYNNLIPNRTGIDVFFIYETANWKSKFKKLNRMWRTLRKIHGKWELEVIKNRTSMCIVKDYNESLIWIDWYHRDHVEWRKQYV